MSTELTESAEETTAVAELDEGPEATEARSIAEHSAAANPVESEEEKRRSNTVAHFEYVYWKQVVVTLAVTASFVLLFPLWPLYMSIQTGNWSYVKNYPGSLIYLLSIMPGFLRHGTLLRGFHYNLLMTPEATRRRLELRQGACTRCGKCCNHVDCTFLGRTDDGQTICTVYNTFYWYYGSCGRYPLTQKDIDDHACPGFSFLDEQGNLVYA